MKKDKGFGGFDFYAQISKETDLEHLNSLLNKYLPIDRENIDKSEESFKSDNEASVKIALMESLVYDIIPEEMFKAQRESIDKMEAHVKKRIEQLSLNS